MAGPSGFPGVFRIFNCYCDDRWWSCFEIVTRPVQCHEKFKIMWFGVRVCRSAIRQVTFLATTWNTAQEESSVGACVQIMALPQKSLKHPQQSIFDNQSLQHTTPAFHQTRFTKGSQVGPKNVRSWTKVCQVRIKRKYYYIVCIARCNTYRWRFLNFYIVSCIQGLKSCPDPFASP